MDEQEQKEQKEVEELGYGASYGEEEEILHCCRKDFGLAACLMEQGPHLRHRLQAL